MSARTKLNGVALAGVLLFAAIVGGIFNSWLIFALVALIGSGLMIYAREVRLQPTRPNTRSRS
jgi:hypothetical protein